MNPIRLMKQVWLCMLVFGIVMIVGCGKAVDITTDTTAELSFFEKNPELKAKLLQWETEAPRGVKREIRRLRTGGAFAKVYAAIRLRNMGERAKGAIPALIMTLDFDNRVFLDWVPVELNTSPAREALKTIVKIGEPAVEPLIAILKDNYLGFSDAAAYALGKIKDARAVEPLIDALKNGGSDVREAAACALGRINDVRAVEPLIDALKNEDSDVRGAAAYALGKIKDARAVEPLIAVLKDEDFYYSDVREAAAWALKQITGRFFGTEDHEDWMRWWQKQKGK